ncbi:MAG: hypothetical protein HYZ39_24665 [Mycolicibacterium cosmeticum]|nr:hypothetical protein [Mycolicibacterium cosmeticum]
MSDETLQVSAPELSSAARDADSAADRLLERYQSMSTEVAQVMEGRWTGAAAQA